MKPSADLFTLVKSLSKYEKRYVTLFLDSGFYTNNANSLRLFKAISGQENFNEESLKKQMGSAFSKRISAEKNKLYELILESMIFLYRDSTAEKRIARHRLRSWFLFQKGLKAPAKRYFQKGKELAEQYESTPWLALFAFQENHETRLSSVSEQLFAPEEFAQRDKKITQALSEELALHTLFTQLIELEKKYGDDPRAAEKQLNNLITHPLISAKQKPASFSAMMSRLDILALYHSMKNDSAKAFQYFGEQVTAIEQSQVYIDQNYSRYVNALSNQLMHAALMRNYEIMPSLVQKTQQANQGILNYFSYDVTFNEFIGIKLFELIAFKNRADTSKGPLLLAQLEKEFTHYRPVLRDTLVIGFLFLFGVYHFYLGNNKKAIQHLNELINSTSIETGQTFQCMARLVKLLLHLEPGNEELLESMIQSTTRLLGKKNRLGAFEKALLSFCKDPANKNNKPGLKKLAAVARKHAPGEYNYGAWCGFEFEAWIESQLVEKPMSVVLKL